MNLLIVSGRSGSGKTVSLQTLEDLGFYCVDNLPVGLILDLAQALSTQQPRIAVGIDARNFHKELELLKQVYRTLEEAGHQVALWYLDAEDSVLLRRFSETRRRHPLTSQDTSLPEALKMERVLLSPIADLASATFDTSLLSKHQLASLIRERLASKEITHRGLQLLFLSFGFKYGAPPEIDFVFDVRCLPNPYWDPTLRSHNGTHPEVKAFLEKETAVCDMVQDIDSFLSRWLPVFEADHRSYVTVGIGCTGGQHRSVFIAEQLKASCSTRGWFAQVRHRDLR